MLSELFETLPEVGDLDKPKMVFFFDEAHLLFSGTSKALLDKIEQVVKLVRSKGVGVYFVTQNPRDVPDNVLAQLNTKIEHGLRAYTPAEQRAVKAAAQAFRENPAFNTYETILALGTGEAVISYLGADGIPTVAQKVNILPPQSRMGSITESERENAIKSSVLYTKYKDPVDPDSAFEFLERRGVEMAEAAAAAAAKAAEEKEAAKAAAAAEREAQKAKEREEAARRRAAQSVGNTVAGTVGREVGKTFGGKFGKFGQTIGGNIGASLGRGVMGTLFNKLKK
jgi:DNA helicase HerA-like ATPase